MKKPNKNPNYLHFLKRRNKKIIKKRSKAKERLKTKRRLLQGKSSFQIGEIRKYQRYETVIAPKNFSFLNNTEDTIDFINKLDNFFKKNKSVFVDLNNVEEIDYSAITVLLSVMVEFKIAKINFNGNFPVNSLVRSKLEDSQFFDRLNKPIMSEPEYSISKKNQIFTKANKMVMPTLGLNVIQESSKTIWGDKRRCFGVQRTLLELMQNTHNHASLNKEGDEFWWLSVNHNEKEKRVSFVFVDYGQGIFESLNNKPAGNKWSNFGKKIKSLAGYSNNAEILQKLLKGELHMTVTGQSFRGKGLPGIMQVLNRNQISNLYIISNNVFANVVKKNYNLLNKKFNGTFLYWELCQNNENKIWNI